MKKNDSASGLIEKHGGYRNLRTFQFAQLIYDITVRFCDRYIDRFSRTRDQMVQAARSGVQNIAEGSLASATSKKTELKLTNVARASLGELCLDYEDFLRQHNLPLWPKTDPRRTCLLDAQPRTADDVAKWVKGQKGGLWGHCGLSGLESSSSESAKSSRSSSYPELSANAALVLIAVAIGLLTRQMKAQVTHFEEHGGFTERLFHWRVQKKR
jgi:four helix bundle suffix protein